MKATDTIGELPDHEEDRKDSGQSSAGTTAADDPWVLNNWDFAWDDVNNKNLDAGKVREARREEMKFIEMKGVWGKYPKEKALKEGYKIVDTRWIDTDKGDTNNPVYRSRLVGKEFNTGQEEGLFASTPPLEALRWLISEAATVEEGEQYGDKVMLISDVSRAFF